MWIFSKDGFLSIVQDRRAKSHLLVRARFNGDIEAIFGDNVVVRETRRADYRFRASIDRKVVAERIADMIRVELKYDNFKNSVKDPDRHGDYMRVWAIMNAAQERRNG